jgi:hypothetical protein
MIPTINQPAVIGLPNRVVVEENFTGLYVPTGVALPTPAQPGTLATDYLPRGWALSLAGSGQFAIKPGYAELYTYSGSSGGSRLRYGEDGGTSLPIYDNRYFSVAKNAVCEALLMVNLANNVDLSFGFVGPNDPNNVCALICEQSASDAPQSWGLQCINNGYVKNLPIGYSHVAGARFYARIETSPTGVIAYIFDDSGAQASCSITDVNAIPVNPLAFELQAGNFQARDGSWPQATYYVSWARLQQSR